MDKDRANEIGLQNLKKLREGVNDELEKAPFEIRSPHTARAIRREKGQIELEAHR